jgi:hypothetical protein
VGRGETAGFAYCRDLFHRTLSRPGTRSAGASVPGPRTIRRAKSSIPRQSFAPVKRRHAREDCPWNERSDSNEDGDQWRQFIRLLTPDEQHASMAGGWKLINRSALALAASERGNLPQSMQDLSNWKQSLTRNLANDKSTVSFAVR